MHMPRKPNRYAEPGNCIQPNDEVYGRWADQLDALPNGFPRTESGIEIRLLKKIARPDEAWLLGQLCRKLDSAEEIGARVGLSSEEVKQNLRKPPLVWLPVASRPIMRFLANLGTGSSLHMRAHDFSAMLDEWARRSIGSLW